MALGVAEMILLGVPSDMLTRTPSVQVTGPEISLIPDRLGDGEHHCTN